MAIRVSEISNKSQKNTSIFDKMTSLVAIKLADNTILLSVPTPEKKYYRMQRNISNTWRIIYGVGEEPTTQVGGPSKTFTDLASSFLFLEKHLQHENIAHYRMLSKNAPWRNKPASYDQQKFLYFYNETEKLTSGEASDRINYHKQPKLIQPKITKQEPIKTVLAITDQQYYRLKNYLKLGKEDLPENRLEAWNEMQQIVREQNRKRYGR